MATAIDPNKMLRTLRSAKVAQRKAIADFLKSLDAELALIDKELAKPAPIPPKKTTPKPKTTKK